MRLELMSLVNDWFAGVLLDYQGVNQGVNAKLAALPLISGHVRPADIATFATEENHDEVARGRIPSGSGESPSVSILCSERWLEEARILTTIREAKGVPLVIRTGDQDVDSSVAVRASHYYARAIVRSLRQFGRNENAPLRTLNGIQVVRLMNDIVHLPIYASFGDVASVMTVIPAFELFDTQP